MLQLISYPSIYILWFKIKKKKISSLFLISDSFLYLDS